MTDKQDRLDGVTTVGATAPSTGLVPGAPTQIGRSTVSSGNPTSDWLAWVRSQVINSVAVGASRQLTCIADRRPIPLIYGEDRIGGQIVNVLPSGLVHADGTKSVVVQILWALKCDSITAVTFNDEPLPLINGLPTLHVFYTGYGADSVYGDFATSFYNATGVTYTDTLQGYAVSYVYLSVNAFAGSLKFEAVLKGRRVFDPRKAVEFGGVGSHVLATPSTWEWSDNPSLCDANFLYEFCGKSVDWASVITAANENDQLVGSDKRRTLNVTIDGRQNAKSVSETLRFYSGNFHVPGGSGVRLIPDRPGTSVASYSHSSGQIAAVRVQKSDTGNLPTESEVVYTNKTVTPWKDDSVFVALDGVGSTLPHRLTTVRLPGINNYAQALREAWERMNRMRTSDMRVTLDVFDQGIKHELGDIITVNHPLWNLDKLFRVGDPEPLSNGRWRLPCVEYDPAGYSNDTAATPSYPDTGFLNPSVLPSTVTGLTHGFGPNGIELSWNTNPELTVNAYELRVGSSNWDSSLPLIGDLPTIVYGTTFIWPPQSAASYTIRIKAITNVGVYSASEATRSVVVSAPVVGNLTHTIQEGNVRLSWSLTSTSNPINFYRIRKSGTTIAEISATQFITPVDWTGSSSVQFTVAGVDTAGNEGTPLAVNVAITTPGAVSSFSAQAILNTVIFYWGAPSVHDLPIASYRMRKGSTWGGGTNIGNKSGDQTFTTLNESEGGDITYWIAPVDSAGNEGTPSSLVVKVTTPANFKLASQFSSTFSGTKTNALLSEGTLYAPVNTTETFHEHFQVNNGPWASPNEQINAGYPIYIEPSLASGSYVEVFSANAPLSAALITIVPTGGWLEAGSNGTITPKIEIADDANFTINVRDLGNVWEAYGAAFQHVRVTLTFGSSSGNDIYAMSALTVKLGLQTEIDSGSVPSSGAMWSAGVATVEFTKPFVDVDSITITVNSTSRREFAYEFTDVANPASFNVRIWDSNGTLTPTPFSWQATGVV